MATKTAESMGASQGSGSSLRGMGWKLYRLFEMPSSARPNLVQACLGLTRLRSWLLSSLVVAAGPYLLFLALATGPGDLNEIKRADWQISLLYPTLTLYLLLLQPLLRQFLANTAQAFVPLLPAAERDEDLMVDAFFLNRRREWLAVGLGVVVGWWLIRTWDSPVLWLKIYGFLGGGLVFGLLGWSTYNILTGTRFLTTLHNQTRGQDVLSVGSLSPLTRWSLGITLIFSGGITLGLLFIPKENLLSPANLILYSTLVLIIVYIFLRGGMSAALLSLARIFQAVVLLIIVALLGTLGYHMLEGWAPLEGLYMTIITMTTIGYGEIKPLSESGRIFTIILSLASVGIAGYTISAVAAFIVEGDFQRVVQRQKMGKQIVKLNDHIVLCGAGRVGMQIATEFHKTRTPFVVIEHDSEVIEDVLRLGDIPYIQGDATKDQVLRLAGIERARGLVATLNDDVENVFVTLSARSLNPSLRIVARLTDEENSEKLLRAGADEIVSPNAIGGMRIASIMIRPSVVNFLDEMLRVTGQTLRMEELHVGEGSALVGKTLGEAHIGRRTGLLIVAIKSQEAGYQFNPGAQTVLRSGDVLIVIGTPEQLAALHNIERA
ncbi:MAG: NAD-binding protein [Anaerolineae bacterium]